MYNEQLRTIMKFSKANFTNEVKTCRQKGRKWENMKKRDKFTNNVYFFNRLVNMET